MMAYSRRRYQCWLGQEVFAEERRDPAVHPGERRAVESGRVVYQFGADAGPTGRKRREQRAVTAVREIAEPFARGACLEHTVAVETRQQPLVLSRGHHRQRNATRSERGQSEGGSDRATV